MKYQSKRNGEIAELVSINERFKTATLLGIDGQNFSISVSTLKRWWKKLPEETSETEYVEEVMQQKKDLGIEIPELDPNQVEVIKDKASQEEASKYVEASQLITAEMNKNNSKTLQEMVDNQAEPKVKEKKQKVKASPLPVPSEILEFLSNAANSITYADTSSWKANSITVKLDGKTYFAIIPHAKTGKFAVAMKAEIADKFGVNAPTYDIKTVKFNLPIWAQELDDKATLKLVTKLIKGGK